MDIRFALNHMTVPRASFVQLLDMAAALGCVGVEVRNDLNRPLFDGMSPSDAGALARDKGLRLLSIAEVTRFNEWSSPKAAEAQALINIAAAAGAEAISLIPRNDNGGMNNGERQANLRVALRDLIPMLRATGIKGLVEPLGFESCGLRDKQEALTAFDTLAAGDTLALIHDTFHHHLAGDGPVFAAQTGLVHVSGVSDAQVATRDMTDELRGLITAGDRLRSTDQLRDLLKAGYTGPVSFEAFAPDLHAIADPVPAIRASMDFMRTSLTANAA